MHVMGQYSNVGVLFNDKVDAEQGIPSIFDINTTVQDVTTSQNHTTELYNVTVLDCTSIPYALTDTTVPFTFPVPPANQVQLLHMKTPTNIAPKLTAGIRIPNGSYMPVPLLVDTGADISILGAHALGKLNQKEMKPLPVPMKVHGIGGNALSHVTWTGYVDLGGAIVQATVYLLPEYQGGLLIGNDIQADLAISISTSRQGIRDIDFKALGVVASYNVRTGDGEWNRYNSDAKVMKAAIKPVKDEPKQPQFGPKFKSSLKGIWEAAVGQFPVLAMKEGESGPQITEKARIPVTDGPPVFTPNYRSALKEQEFIKNKLKDLLDKGIIRTTRSEWNSPLLIVPKVGSDEKFRLVIDYRKLNTRVAGDTYPLPHIDDLLTKTAKAKIFSKLDLTAGFHQIPVDPRDQDYLAFTAIDNAYTYNYVPFGLNIAPAIFTRILNRALVSCMEFTAIYVDDILIFSDSLEDHKAHLKAVLVALGMANFRVSLKKSIIGEEKVHYLGHILLPGQVQQDPSKISVVKDFPEPKTVRAVRRFIGLTGYYRKFVKDYAKIAAPLMALMTGKGRVSLDETQRSAFSLLKDAMTTAPVLHLYQPRKETRVEVDSCALGVGAILSQRTEETGSVKKWKPVSYFSKKFPETVKSYASREMEMYGIYLSVVHWRVWLLGYFFTILSDHESLSVATQSNNSRRIKKWLLGMAEYKYVIKYRRGILHRAPDALSRMWTPIENDELDEDEQAASVQVGETDSDRKDPITSGTQPKDETEHFAPVDMSGVDEDLESFEPLASDPPEEVWDDIDLVLPTKEQWAEATLRCRELAPIARLLNHEVMDDFVDRVEAKSTIDKHGLYMVDGIILDQKGIKWVPEEYRSLVCDLFHSTPFAMHHDAKQPFNF